jgi:DNA gyrase inhibitor GyrI
MAVEIKEMPELRIATVRHVGPYNHIPQAFGRLQELAGPAGLFAEPGATMVGIYYDDPESTDPDQPRSDAGVFAGQSQRHRGTKTHRGFLGEPQVGLLCVSVSSCLCD